ncbi:MAG: DCC1-like thiol-disulfide oxidoreductase family protein [Pikeienuella sp.]
MTTGNSVKIYYDGDCPFCSRYAALQNLKKNYHPVELINLRHNAAARDFFTTTGINVDQGMVVEVGGQQFVGQEAVNSLAIMSSNNGLINRLSASLFKSQIATRIAYPFLRAGRNITLLALGRRFMAPENDGDIAKRQIFAFLFGVFTLFHVIAYFFRYQNEPSFDLFALGAVAAVTTLRPASMRALLALFAMSLISGWVQAPLTSNHTFLRNIVALGFAIIFLVHLLRGKTFEQMFRDFSFLGGLALMVMYVFGVFHKINTGFLDPEISCGPALWAKMPPPLSWLGGPVIDQMAIWGTYMVETALLIGLITNRFRHISIVVGIGFHLLLSATNFSMFIPFTMLAISLHALFLSPKLAENITTSPLARWSLTVGGHPPRSILFAIVVVGACFATLIGMFQAATLAALIMVGPLLIAIALNGGVEQPSKLTRSGRMISGFVAAAFFFSCLTPYAGIRTAQSMNMFANIRLEGDVSNHLVFGAPAALNDIVDIHQASGDHLLSSAAKRQLLMHWKQVLHQLDQSPDAIVSYSRNGQRFDNITATDLTNEIASLPHPWVRKYIQFQVVKDGPPTCF